jgi:uncharacterized protein YjbJ (UPF0337 family)
VSRIGTASFDPKKKPPQDVRPATTSKALSYIPSAQAQNLGMAPEWERLYRSRVRNTARRYGPPSGVPIMSGTTDKISGIANEAIGKAKQGVGSVVGSEKLKGEGAAQEVKGDAQKAVGDAKNAVKDGANKVADAVNKNL